MEGQTRETLGERLANRLSSRAARRPRMALDASFYARFGLEDPWGAPEAIGAEGASGDGMVFLSGAPFYAMMRRLALSRRRRERRQERFFERRAGTTMRAATRRWSGEGEASPPQFRMAHGTIDEFVLPPPIGAVTEPLVAAEVDAAPGERAPNPPMRKSPWHTTPFVPARVSRGTGPSERAERPRPLARVGERLVAAASESAQVVTVAGQLPARARRAIATVVEDVFPPDMPVVEVVRILRRIGAPTSVIREVIEFAPAAAAMSVAARRMPVGPTAGRPAGLRTVMSRSPAMAMAASPDADHAAAGTLATAERSEVRTGSVRPRRASVGTASTRASARAAAPLSSALLSASPVGRVSAGRPAALRAPSPIAAGEGAPGPSASVTRVTRRIGGTFVPARSVAGPAERADHQPYEQADAPVLPGSAHAVSRIERAAVAPRRFARTDGAAWAHVRSDLVAPGPQESAVPSPVVALRAPARARTAPSATRPVLGAGGRVVTARFAAAAAAAAASAAPVPGAPRGPRAARLVRASRPRLDLASTALSFPSAGATPVQQALARFDAAEVAVTSPAASVVPHATPRLDRPVRRASVLDAGSFSPVAPIGAVEVTPTGAAEAVAASGVRPVARPLSAAVRSQVAQAAPRGVASRALTTLLPAPPMPAGGLSGPSAVSASPVAGPGTLPAPSRAVVRAAARAESPSRTAARRLEGLRVSTSEVVRATSPVGEPSVAAATPAASGPMSWASAPTFRVPSRLVGRRGPVSLPLEAGAVPGSMPVREPSGRFVASRSVRSTERGVPRLVAVGSGRVDVVYVSPDSAVASGAATAAPSSGASSAVRSSAAPSAPPSSAASATSFAPRSTPPRAHPVRALAWATSRSNLVQATAYRGAISDGGLPASERILPEADAPSARANRTVSRATGATLAGPAETLGSTAPSPSPSPSLSSPAAAVGRPGTRPAARPSGARSPVGRDRPGRDAAALARPGNQLSPSAFVAPTFGFDAPADAPQARPAGQIDEADAPSQTRSRAARPPLDRRLHELAAGGATSASDAPTWNARADGAPRVRSVQGLFESLARATTAEQVVHVLFARADGLMSTASEIAAPIQQVISEIRQEVSRAPAAAASDDAALPTRPMRVDAPRAEPLRPKAGGARPSSTTRVVRGATRPVASRTRTIGAGSEDRIMKLVKKLQGLIHLAEAEHRLAEAQRQVRMAEDSHEARGEGGQGTRGGGQAGGNQDGSKMDIEQLGREVLDVVSRELEYRRERRMEDHDESIWW